MTAPYWDGFETVVDDSDFRIRGWTRNTANALGAGATVVGYPSQTVVAGSALKLRGPYAATSASLPNQSGTVDFGMLDTGLTINSLWTAGGFSLYGNLTFNSGSQIQVGFQNTSSIIYDGVSTYWAIGTLGSATLNVYSSPDLVNWTPTSAAPPAITSASNLAVIGSGGSTILVIDPNRPSVSDVEPLNYSTNLGVTWTSVANFTGTPKGATATGNATKSMVTGNVTGSGAASGLYVSAGPADVSPIQVYVSGGTTFAQAWNGKRVPNAAAIAMYYNLNTTWHVAISANDLTVTGNWITSAAVNAADIDFIGNQWIAGGAGGIFTAPNSATLPTIAGPTAAWTNVLTSPVVSIAASSTVAVAVGLDPTSNSLGAIWTSADGTNWVKNTRLIGFSSAVGFAKVFWDGSRFVVVGGASNNVIGTSTDGYKWHAIYYPDYTEVAGTGGTFGINGGALNTAGLYTGPTGFASGNVYGVGWNVGALSGGFRTVSGITNALASGANVTQTVQVSSSVAAGSTALTHAYEVLFIPGTTANTFTIQYFIDSVALGPATSAIALAASSDTTSAHALINLPRFGNFTVVDDLIIATKAGTTNVAPMGTANITGNLPASDATVAWTRGGAQASNAAAVNQGSVSNAIANSGASNFVTSTGTGVKDSYNMSATVPVNYRVGAVQTEAAFAKTGAAAPTVSVGILSGSTESDSSAVSIQASNLSAPTRVTFASETDPSTGLAWTNAGALASKPVITKIS